MKHRNHPKPILQTQQSEPTLSYSQYLTYYNLTFYQIVYSTGSLYGTTFETPSSLVTLDVSDVTNPKLINSYDLSDSHVSLALSSDAMTLYTIGTETLMIFDISPQLIDLSTRIIPTFQRSIEKPYGISTMIICMLSKTAFITNDDLKGNVQVEIIDLTENSSSPIISSISVDLISLPTIGLSAEENILYVTTKQGITSFNVTDLSSPSLLYNYTIQKEQQMLAFLLSSFSDFRQTMFLSIADLTSLYLQVLDISNPISFSMISNVSVMISHDVFPLAQCESSFLPGNRYLILVCGTVNYAFDLADLNSPIALNLTTFDDLSRPVFADHTIGFVAANDLETVAFSLDIKFDSLYPLQSNILGQIDPSLITMGPNLVMGLSSDAKMVFTGSCDDTNAMATVTIFNISNSTLPTVISTTDFPNTTSCSSLGSLFAQATSNDLDLYMPFINLNLSNLTLPTEMQISNWSSSLMLESVAIRDDTSILACLALGNFRLHNMTNHFELIYSKNVSTLTTKGVVLLSSDIKTAFIICLDTYASPNLLVFDMSNLYSVKQIASERIPWGAIWSPLFAAALSPDDRTILVITDVHLQTWDVSDLTSPTLINTLNLPSNFGNAQISISADSRTAFIVSNRGGLIRLDILNRKSPSVVGYDPNVVAFGLAPDNVTAYLIDRLNGFQVVNLNPKIMLYMPTKNFEIGETISNYMCPLQHNNDNNRYEFSTGGTYKFGPFSLYSIDTEPEFSVTHSALPPWVSFNADNQMLTIEAGAEIGTYDLYTTLFSKVPNDAFTEIGMDTTTSQELMIFLTTMGYLDIQGFTTSNFDPSVPLLLSSEYSGNETAISKVLTQYYFQVTTRFDVTQSLEIIEWYSPPLAIETLSRDPVKVEIVLQDSLEGVKFQFVDMVYSNSITTTLLNNQSSITMEGPVYAVNLVLSSLIVNLNGEQGCDGMISVSDGLNPPYVNHTIPRISVYFRKSLPPVINPTARTLQDQINDISIETGSTFFIQFEQDSFNDPNNEDLIYTLSMAGSKDPPPPWVQLKGLALYGTPPEDFYHFKYSFVITATNQFLSADQEFDMKISLSLLYGAKLATELIGALVTAIGMWVYAGTFYNIIFKKLYRYPKDWELAIGEEILTENLPTIAFVSNELKVCKLVIAKLKKAVAIQMNCKKISNTKLAQEFLNPQTRLIDKVKLNKALEEIRDKFSSQTKEQMKQFSNTGRQIIIHLVENELINECLNIKGEKVTKRAFNAIKKNWINLIGSDFKIDKTKVEKALADAHFSVNKESVQGSTSKSCAGRKVKDGSLFTNENDSAEVPLVPSSGSVEAQQITMNPEINMKLLEAALGAYVFSYHSLDIDPVDVDIEVKKQVNTRSPLRKIQTFLKLDLKTKMFLNKGEIGNGIKYQIKNNFLNFSGALSDDLEGEALVVQIKTKRGGRILREIWFKHTAPPPKIPGRARETSVEFVPMFRSLIVN